MSATGRAAENVLRAAIDRSIGADVRRTRDDAPQVQADGRDEPQAREQPRGVEVRAAREPPAARPARPPPPRAIAPNPNPPPRTARDRSAAEQDLTPRPLAIPAAPSQGEAPQGHAPELRERGRRDGGPRRGASPPDARAHLRLLPPNKPRDAVSRDRALLEHDPPRERARESTSDEMENAQRSRPTKRRDRSIDRSSLPTLLLRLNAPTSHPPRPPPRTGPGRARGRRRGRALRVLRPQQARGVG